MGAFMLSSAILFFLLPLELAGNNIPWAHPLVYGLFILSIAICCLFIFVEAYWAKEPILAIRLLASWNIVIPNTVGFCQAAAQLGVRRSFLTKLCNPVLTMTITDDVHSTDIFPGNSKYIDSSSRSAPAPGSHGCYGRWAFRGLRDQKVNLCSSAILELRDIFF
jgi:hypothetical protein